MGDEARRSDRASSILGEDRCEVHDELFRPANKRAVVAVHRKLEGVEHQMATIRSRLEARRGLERGSHLPAVTLSPIPTSATVETTASTDRLKLPLLRRIERTRVANAPPKDPFLDVENVIHRSTTRKVYVRDAEIVATKELAAASATKEAQHLGEEARKRMVAYTQNESAWRFEERTYRYQQVMEMKQQAEKAQQEADLQRETARTMKALLRDPYGGLKTTPAPRIELTPLPASALTPPLLRKKEHEWIWFLASPSTKLAFTPRDETTDTVLDSEKELSMYVVYYIAASHVKSKRVETEEQWQAALNSDFPPTSGWMCCSVHGLPPAPELTTVRRFKSSTGVELFRKCVPVASPLSQALHDGESTRPESAGSSVTDEELAAKGDSSKPARKQTKPSVALPSGVAAIEQDELDFRSMQRVGSWLSMNESVERNRRMLASRSASGESAAPGGSKDDGSSVMNQDSREVPGASDVAESRPEVSAPLCREWVLFARCCRRRAEISKGGATEPPMKGVGLGCLKRHYYLSFEEKKQMTVWVQTKESWLEKNVLAVIIEREAQMERVHHLSRKCMVNFQQNLRAETEKAKAKLLAELNRVRFLSVQVLEAIDRWRQQARKIGFARYDNQSKQDKGLRNVGLLSSEELNKPETEVPLLGWSASITLDTGKQLYKGSKAFASKVRRFRRSEDITGKREQHIVYLGYYETQEEAERAYDEHAASEARRLNTTAEHLPRRRNVFRSCGKHFAVESEKDGPSCCIECKTKQLASLSSAAADEWVPPFFYGSGVNYIMEMASDLDFLEDVLPLKAALNDGRGSGGGDAFPMRGNVFLLPKTPIQDPDLAVFTTFPTPTAPRLGEASGSPGINDIDDEALDRERIFKAQQIFLQELQIYRPELIFGSVPTQSATKKLSLSRTSLERSSPQYRLVEALYWDHCAALKIQQERPPLALRQPNIWCRPDAGEWSSLVVRGAHQLHFLFEEKLEKAGKDMVHKRTQVLAALRQLNKVPLYFVPSRTSFTDLISAGQQVRGDVVQLEVNNATKRLQRYDSWCAMSLLVQRWLRGVRGRQRARSTRKALRVAYQLRVLYVTQIAAVAKAFYDTEVRATAVRRAYRSICTPVYTRTVVMDGESVVVMFYSLRHYHLFHKDYRDAVATKQTVLPSSCCTSCARRFQVKANYQSGGKKFAVFRGVCTCSLNGGRSRNGELNSEAWLIRAYSPSHNVIYRLRVETPQLHQLISSQTHLQLSIPRYHPLILDMETKQLKATAASRYATFCFENAEKAAKNVANWRRMNSEATQTRKSLLVELEKCLSLLDSTKQAHVVSVGNAKKALEFASRPFSEAQAWDPLENANDWRFIVEKRQLAKRLEEKHQEVERLRVAYFQATYNEQYTRAGASGVQDDYNRTWLPLVERENRAMEEAILLETSTRTRMEGVMEQLCGRFLTLRDGYLVPTRRNLVIQSPIWHSMVPSRLDIPGLRRRLNHLRRRTLVLSNLALQNRKTRRMVVTVSRWPLLARSSQGSHTKRDLWVTAYDPVDCSVHNIFLEWELVQLLTGSSGRKIWQDPRHSKRRAWRSIADLLLSLTMLDRFTGEFTLQKLQFYHTLRRLSPQFLSSRMMRDLHAGRKSGQGDEVLRQAVSVDGRLCVVVVYENWGDLTFAIYHTASGAFFRLELPLREVFDLLGNKPLMVRLWISCVKSNTYASTLLVYLMKHVRFYQCDNGSEDVRIELELPARKRSKRYQTVLRIQKRQVLVSIDEDITGDFQVSGYDMNSDFVYKLLLEREALHRMLKTSTLSTDRVSSPRTNLATSCSSLLLRRNRKMLYEWICSRLRFQSMLEHPELVASGTSPLLFGLHLRASFRTLNRWIASSPRNPVNAVSEEEITHRAAAVDAAAFSSLQFDQLTLVANPRLPFELEKEFVGTMDWIEAVAGSSPRTQTWKKQLPYLRMDLFVEAHRLFARVRGELEAETKERKKRETWAGMKQEDHDALVSDIISLVSSAKAYISSTCQKLFDLHTAAVKKIDQWHQVHFELRVVTKSAEVENDLLVTLDAAHMLQEDRGGFVLDFLKVWMPTASTELHEFISLAVPVDSWRPLVSATSVLQVCSNRFDLELKPILNNLELTFERIERRNNALEELRLLKSKAMQFCTFLTRQPAASTAFNEPENDMNTLGDGVNAVEVNHEEVADMSVVIPTTSVVNTGILIPSDCKEPIQEVFLADMPTWTPTSSSSFMVHAQAVVKHLRSFFQQQWRQQHAPSSRFGRHAANGTGDLTCQRVPYGVLVYQATAHDAYTRNQLTELNPRAGALIGGRNICGPSLFWPLQVDCDWYQRLLDCGAIYMDLASSDDPELEEGSLKRPSAVRSTKYLPWKQFAIERLRISQAVKRSRIREGVCIDSLENSVEEVEKGERTVATCSIGLRQLEISLGKRSSREFCGNMSVTKSMTHCFALHSQGDSNKRSANWHLSINNPRILRNVLQIYDPDGRAIEIPRIGREDTEVLKMENVQAEIDDVDKPRRLIFSCRESQTQRKFFVDCDYHSLHHLLQQREQKENPEAQIPILLLDEGKSRHRAMMMTVHGWRKCATLAAQFLVLRKKNGVFSLCLELYTPEAQPQGNDEAKLLSEEDTAAVEGSEADNGNDKPAEPTAENVLIEKIPVQPLEEVVEMSKKISAQIPQRPGSPAHWRCRADLYEERKAVQQLTLHHFRKHQPAIRAAACGRIMARTVDTGSCTASEWMQMTREDWSSQELRGALVLDANVLSKLEKAYASAVRRARDYLQTATKEEDTGGLKLQMNEIVKAMSQTPLQSNEVEILQSIRMKRWRRRGKEASAAAKRAEAYLADVAEWWRWRLTTIQPDKPEKK
ncbi:hypothetical protein PHYPSEUDO_005823 [Phytophthora pseudosyringae]|uniref:Uncharacterized protein n=1 Tax=Phytophthora pseudosyringae TaxID=221518 RepID=A0A8T1VNE7_9STRA|nr:hypothetical protein PHYPSEUDO_005823 [Phytophthora pseudosyringae]